MYSSTQEQQGSNRQHTGGATKEPRTQSTQVIAHNASHMLHREQDPQEEAIKDYRHTEAREGLCDSEEL